MIQKFPVDQEQRRQWASARAELEKDDYKHKRFGIIKKSHWTLFERLVRFFGFFLKIGRIYKRGHKNARNVVVNEYHFLFDDLPPAFERYRLVHLTDLHLDCIPGIEETISNILGTIDYDFCVITGDYREKTHGPYKQIVEPMRRVIEAIDAPDGKVAILGNHDTFRMVDEFEKMGLRVLVNETVHIERNGEKIHITGVDDPNTYYTEAAMEAVQKTNDGFKILLAHSPEMWDLAQQNHFHLYLTGHTHGGQICLPGGIPLITHLKNGRRFYRGRWQVNGMIGFTSQGCGASGIPVRFNTQSEIAVITLRCNGSDRRGNGRADPED